ncbi:hypothetical protein [Sphingosinicella sp. BN140058]|uniref:hypothetical protein n=1 Tax=Sphingosinicella sp. BN140058 TaxID=1892855 RepID=UPI0013EB669C|nr:hypothetical protein [Sphingosinicella sp. BN140058]
MSWRCTFGLHQPYLTSVTRKGAGLRALCEGCATPLERSESGRWSPAAPLATR